MNKKKIKLHKVIVLRQTELEEMLANAREEGYRNATNPKPVAEQKEEIKKAVEKKIETGIHYLCEECGRPTIVMSGNEYCLYCKGYNDGISVVPEYIPHE